jgi:hypothetical protein
MNEKQWELYFFIKAFIKAFIITSTFIMYMLLIFSLN